MAIFGVAAIVLGILICVEWVTECVIYVIKETRDEKNRRLRNGRQR